MASRMPPHRRLEAWLVLGPVGRAVALVIDLADLGIRYGRSKL